MTITSVSKAQIYIGGTSYPTDMSTPPALADYTSETWTVIGQTTNIGDFGDTAEEIKVNTISDARTYKLKGQRDAGDLSLECAFNDADAGQAAIMAALQNDGNYSFKVVLNNPGPTAKASTTYFRGMVVSAQTKLGAANSAVLLATKIAINSAPLAVAAS